MVRTDMPDVSALRLINFSCTKKHSPEDQLRGEILYHLHTLYKEATVVGFYVKDTL